jgi:hypothetical protein
MNATLGKEISEIAYSSDFWLDKKTDLSFSKVTKSWAGVRRVKYGALNMNMISTGSFLTEMDASNKQSTLAEKFAAVWEKKNAKAARAGGVSLMALSLAACGSDDDTAAEAPVVDTTPTVDPVESQALTDGLDILDAGNDNVFAGELTLTSGDRIETTGYVELDLSAVTLDGQTILANNVIIDASGGVTIDASDWTVSNVEVEDSTGSVTINDIQSATTALHADDVVDAAATITYNFDAQAVAGTADNVSLTVSEVTAAVAVTGGNVETLTVNIADVSTNAESTLADLTATGNTTLVITGGTATYDFTVTDELDAALTTVDGSAALSDLNLDMGESTTTMTVSGGAGADVLDMGDTLGDSDEQDTLDGNGGADQMTADFTTVGTRNPISTEIETYNLTFSDDATLDFTDVDDVATINIAESAGEVELIDMDATVTTINVSGDHTGTWDVDYELNEDANLTVNWANNTDAADVITGIVFDEVKTLTINSTGTDDIDLGNVEFDANHDGGSLETLTDLTINVTGNGDLLIDDDDHAAADGTMDSVQNLTLTTTGGDLTIAASAGNSDHESLERLVMSATRGDITMGAIGTGDAAAQLEYVTMTTDGGAISQGVVTATGATISTWTITAGDDAASNVTVGDVTAEDISEMTVTIEQDATVALDDFVLAEAGDTLTVSGEGNLTIHAGAAVGGNTASDDSFFAVANFSGMTVHDIVVDLSGVDHAMTITGTGLGDTITGGDGADTINGGAGGDTLNGEQGADTIDGGAGDDEINGMAGNDTLTGGAGADDFNFTAAGGTDTITDFTSGSDDYDVSVLHGFTAARGDLIVASTGANEAINVDSADATDAAVGYVTDARNTAATNSVAVEDLNDMDDIAVLLEELFAVTDDTADDAGVVDNFHSVVFAVEATEGTHTGLYIWTQSTETDATIDAAELTHIATATSTDLVTADFIIA